MNRVHTTLAAALLASTAATAAPLSASPQDTSIAEPSPTMRLLEESAADGKSVPAYDLPLVVRDDQGNVVLDARTQGPLPLARLASAGTDAGVTPGNAEGETDSMTTAAAWAEDPAGDEPAPA